MSNITSSFSKALLERVAASLFAVTIVGGVGGLLTMSLANARPALANEEPTPAAEMASIQQTAIETVVVYGTRPANYASLVAHRKHRGAIGAIYASLQHGR